MKILNLPDELQTQVYLPETIDECRKISCTDCICLSHRQEGCPCQFNVYLATHAARKTAGPDMLKGCVKGNAKPSSLSSRIKAPALLRRLAEDDHSKLLLEAINLLNKIDQNIIKSIELQQEPDNPKMVFKMEEQPCDGCVGSLDTLSYVCVGRKNLTSREYYHHCPEQRGRLIRLEYSYEREEEFCPVCDQAFVSK